jgi:hypothetical protein
MIATVGTPGGEWFAYKRFRSRKKAQQWCKAKLREWRNRGVTITRGLVLTNREAWRWRWLDGRRLFAHPGPDGLELCEGEGCSCTAR